MVKGRDDEKEDEEENIEKMAKQEKEEKKSVRECAGERQRKADEKRRGTEEVDKEEGRGGEAGRRHYAEFPGPYYGE